ncbi:MAG: hypothetical protein BroJett025_10660 [Patescibacteria group bacterium]|nr:MAG: hypothetical protein BroJett025_10660 [Patescibacteria group bacterium]
MSDDTKKKNAGFQSLGDLFTSYQLDDKGGHITQEFQDYGYRLAIELNDLKHKSLYIKMAKTIERSILERALTFVKDADSAKSKARLFMWKVKQLRQEVQQKHAKN